MRASILKKKYLEFFKSKGHAIIKSSPLIPENDPSVLFTTAGMHPLVPHLLGTAHPEGNRLADVQKCIRTGDIDEVGDDVHLTFFEMLGNWSLGDYFKKEAIEWSFEFLTSEKWLNLDTNKLAITCFAGDSDAPKDEEAAEAWMRLGILKERIAFLPKADNWWGPAGDSGPCGPDTEMFYWVGEEEPPKKFDPRDSRWVEIWNDVFMQYNKTKIKAILVDAISCLFDEKRNLNKDLFDLLMSYNIKLIIVTNADLNDSKNKPLVDISRQDISVFTLKNNPDKTNPLYFEKLLDKYQLKSNELIYFDHSEDNIDSAKKLGINSELYISHMKIKDFIDNNLYYYEELKQKNVDTGMGVERTAAVIQGKKSVYDTEVFAPIIQKIQSLTKERNEKYERIIADHLKAAVFILGDEIGTVPSNLGQGYVLRRLIRKAIRLGRLLDIKENFTSKAAETIIDIYKNDYVEIRLNKDVILKELEKEEERFSKTLESGLKQFDKITKNAKKEIPGKDVFILFSTYGFPIEMTEELAREKGLGVDRSEFDREFRKHQELSRTATEKVFKGGLSDASYENAKLHTATHLLHAALRKVLGEKVQQKGSNITPERLRFDFAFDRKLTDEEIKKVEGIVNEKIKEGLPVIKKISSPEEAKKEGALAFFGHKYGDKISIYDIKGFSKEICMGPHVENTKELGKFKIVKEEAVAAGVRRIKAVLE